MLVYLISYLIAIYFKEDNVFFFFSLIFVVDIVQLYCIYRWIMSYTYLFTDIQIEQIITGIINVVSLIELTVFTIKRPCSQP